MMHLHAWRKRECECHRQQRVFVGAPELTNEGSARRSAGPAGPDPRPKAASGQRLATYGPVDEDGAACGTPIWWSELLCGAASPARGSRYSL